MPRLDDGERALDVDMRYSVFSVVYPKQSFFATLGGLGALDKTGKVGRPANRTIAQITGERSRSHTQEPAESPAARTRPDRSPLQSAWFKDSGTSGVQVPLTARILGWSHNRADKSRHHHIRNCRGTRGFRPGIVDACGKSAKSQYYSSLCHNSSNSIRR